MCVFFLVEALTAVWWNEGFPRAAELGGFNRLIFHVYLTHNTSMPGPADVS